MWHCKHYTGRGVMKFYETGADLAKDMQVPLQTLVDVHDAHYEAAKKTEKDPDGGSWPAYPSGKSWDEPNGKTGSGKKFYHNIIPGSAVATQPFYVAIITPVIHYCMGGLEIDADSACISANGKAIPGLYAAGEVAGGVHGNNRLGGNSLLDCVVFGRVAGKHCAKYMLGKGIKETSLAKLSGEGEGTPVSADASNKAMSKLGPTKDPTKEAYYNAEKWQGHLRGKTMGYWLKRQDEKRRAESKAAKKVEDRALEEGVLKAPAWQERERECLDQHYFLFPHERGQNNLMPWFRQTRDHGHVQVFRWLREAWAATSDTGKRKTALISAMLTLTFVVTEVIKATPHD